MSFNQADQRVKNQINIAGDGNIGQVGDRYEIAQAQIIMTQEFAKTFADFWNNDQAPNYTELPDRESWEPETVLVPAGSFQMGSDPAEGVPDYDTTQFEMTLPAYRIGKYPVTNEQYFHFIQETKQIPQKELGWRGGKPSAEQANLPVQGVTWYGALVYCYWLMEETERPYTLPSEAQWEKAARGADGITFPWGNEWQAGNCNTDHKKVTAVDAFPAAESPYGCFDMVGNVREWTTTTWGRKRRPQNNTLQTLYLVNISWKPNEAPDKIDEHRQIRRITRGGAALLPNIPLRATRRQSELPYRRGIRFTEVGFRVVLNWEA